MNPQDKLDAFLQVELTGKQIFLLSEEVHSLTDTKPYTGQARRDHYVLPDHILPGVEGIFPATAHRKEYEEAFAKYGVDAVFIGMEEEER